MTTPGSALLRAVAVMDQLRSAGGCPWDAEQTHESLLRYLVEECYELVQAVEDGDRAAMLEELGDVLLQVLFHARIAAEARADGFDIDDVAAGLVDKLIRRHPHVFGSDPEALSVSEQSQRWDELKKAEHDDPSPLDGVAFAQPAAALAAKLGARSVKYDVSLEENPLPDGESAAAQIFRLAFAAGARGEDLEGDLRRLAQDWAQGLSGRGIS